MPPMQGGAPAPQPAKTMFGHAAPMIPGRGPAPAPGGFAPPQQQGFAAPQPGQPARPAPQGAPVMGQPPNMQAPAPGRPPTGGPPMGGPPQMPGQPPYGAPPPQNYGQPPPQQPYGQLWLDNYCPVARDFGLWIAGVSNVGWINAGPWQGRQCIGCSLVIGPDGKQVLMGPFGVAAETILYVDVQPGRRPASGP